MRYLLFIFLLAPFWAQAQYMEDVLLLEKVGSQRAAWFQPGDTVRYRLKGEKEWTRQVLERFTPEGTLRFTIDTVALSEIDAIDIFEQDTRRRRNAAYGKTFLIVAAGYTLIDQLNITLQTGKPDFSPRVLATSGLIALGATWFVFRGKRHQKVGGRWRLRITPLPERLLIN